MTLEEKIRVARQLERLKVDVIEAGFPIASPGDFESVREIVRMRSMTPIPRVSNAVRGVVSLRGEIVQVLDLRQRLRLPAAEPSRASRIVVVHLEDGRVAGLLVDAVREVMKVDADAVLPPTAGEASAVEALCQRGNTFVSMIDLQRVLEFDVES